MARARKVCQVSESHKSTELKCSVVFKQVRMKPFCGATPGFVGKKHLDFWTTRVYRDEPVTPQ